MADIIIKGQAHEATVRMNYTMDGYEFVCSKGAWCTVPHVRIVSLEDVINEAIVHVDQHDADVDAGVPDHPHPWEKFVPGSR